MNKEDNGQIVNDEISKEIEENVLPPENIVVLNELRSASDLYRLMADVDSIDINPDFQRDEVWSLAGRARFIDSMSKEFPIPSMCFALDPKEQKYIVIDGLQRMSTIKHFLDNPDLVLPKLKDIDERLSGKSAAEIKEKSPSLYRRIENLSLPVTILRYDPTRDDNMEYIFTIFQRLNTFGERLNNQEIRNAIFQGSFNTFLKEKSKDPKWTEIVRTQKQGRNSRMSAEEKLLRFFAFYDEAKSYSGKYNLFLNEYMQKNRFSNEFDKKEKLLEEVTSIVRKIGIKEIGKSNALIDAVLYGIAQNIDLLENQSAEKLRSSLQRLKDDENFSVESLSGGTMQKGKVSKRFSVAKKLFATSN